MRLSPSDKRFAAAAVIMVLLVAAVLLITNSLFSGRIEKLQDEIAPLERDIEKNRSGRFLLDEHVSQFERLKREVSDTRDKLKERLEFPFPGWVNPPKDSNPGEYFITMHAQRREDARATCTMKGVQLLDRNLGFDRPGVIDRERAVEDLQTLSIVEKLINLLTDIKVTAIVNVSPQDSVLTGSYRMVDNPASTPRGGMSKKKRVPNPAFIREYPVRIKIVSDLTTLMRFLSSVRQENQFFLIRDITINADMPKERGTADLMRPGDVYVTIAAAAMRFLSPEEHAAEIEEVRRTQQWRFRTPTRIEPMGF